MKDFKNSDAFIEYLNDLQDVGKSIQSKKLGVQSKKGNVFIKIHDLIADMTSNKKFQPAVTELFIRGRKSIISLIFITQS